MRIALTVFFESPFWVGVAERTDDLGQLSAARHVFGPEPSEPEVHAWLLRSFSGLTFSPAQPGGLVKPPAANPKRRQREAARAIDRGIGTRAQQALQAGREAAKEERRIQTRAQREAEARRQYLLKREREKQRHSGH